MWKKCLGFIIYFETFNLYYFKLADLQHLIWINIIMLVVCLDSKTGRLQILRPVVAVRSLLEFCAEPKACKRNVFFFLVPEKSWGVLADSQNWN